MLSNLLRSIFPDTLKHRLRRFVWMRLNPSWLLQSGILIHVLNYTDWIIYNDIFVEGEYDEPLRDLLRTNPTGRPLRILDLGGNVGFFTLRLADRLLRAHRQDFEVTMVEGAPSNFAELQTRLAKNREVLAGRVTARHGLVGERAGGTEIAESDSHGENTIIAPARHGKQVAFLDLDPLVADWERIDLLKCDIEGAEELFLRNYPDLLRKTDRAVFEFHHEQCDIPACRALLAAAGLERAQTVREFGHCSVEFFRRDTPPE